MVVVMDTVFTAVDEILPALLGATAVYIFFHYYAEFAMNKKEASGASSQQQQLIISLLRERLALLALIGAFVYHGTAELFKILAVPSNDQGAYHAVVLTKKVGIIAATVGFYFAGTGRSNKRTTTNNNKSTEEQSNMFCLLDHALNTIRDPIAITASERRIVWSNSALKRICPDSSRQRNLTTKQLRHCFDEDRVRRIDVPLNDTIFSVEVTPYRHEATIIESPSFLIVMKDVCDLRTQEQAGREAEKKLLLKQSMKESMETLSHELRTPLQAVMGMTSLILESDDVSVEECKESMSVIMASSRLLLTLINNLLDIRKCDANMLGSEFELTPQVLPANITKSVNFCRPLAAITNVTIELKMEEVVKEITVQLNSLRFQQIVVNLISNAIKFSSRDSTIQLCANVMPFNEVENLMEKSLALALPVSQEGLHQGSNVVVVAVADDGPGVAKDVADRVFSRHSQVTTLRSSLIGGDYKIAQSSGTGLGLNFCVEFVKRMNGNIWVSNRKSGGASFSFYLPVFSVGSGSNRRKGTIEEAGSIPKVIAEEPRPDKKARTPSFSRISDLSVMIVDDTVINLKVLDRMLRKMGIAKLTTVDSGPKALCLLEEKCFDLVITDIQMPEMTGIELCENIQRDQKIETKPVVVGLTAGTSESLRRQCAASGMPHVLHKPITVRQIQYFFVEILLGLERCNEYVAPTT